MVAKKKNSSVNVAALLPSLVRNKGWKSSWICIPFFQRWHNLVNEDFAEHAAPLKIERGVLWLEVKLFMVAATSIRKI